MSEQFDRMAFHIEDRGRLIGWQARRIATLEALLRELIDIEGPQPGTATWAAKVHAALAPEQDI